MEEDADLAVYWLLGAIEDAVLEVRRWEAIGTTESKARGRAALVRIRDIVGDFESRYPQHEDGQGRRVG